MKDSVLIFLLSYNNHIFLRNFFEGYEKYSAGYPNEIIILDNSSTDQQHLKELEKLSKKYKVETYPNDRAECSFSEASKRYINQYKYYMFLHDDTSIIKDNWLKVFIDRINSNYCEPEVNITHYSHYPVGRCSSIGQYWRSHNEVKGFPVQSIFLKNFLDIIGYNVPIYKFTDTERVVYTNSCLFKTGIFSLGDMKKMELEENDKFNKICEQINKDLQYSDEGIQPKVLYPANKCWNKMTMISEFMNSILPLINGFRTVGLEGDGYLEQLDGNDEPWGHKYIYHLGSPNMKRFLARELKTDTDTIHKKIYSKDITFLKICDKIIKEELK